jgi:DNA-binding response OmpR family regulator
VKTILCVEDEIHILNNHRKFLTGKGYDVLAAETAAKARELIEAHMPDVILLDIMLPDGNGLDLLTEWRSAGIKTPIVMLTAWGTPKDISTGYRLGATAYFSKPFDYEAVLALLESFFSDAEKVPERVTCGGLSLNMMSGQAFLNNKDLLLSQKEFSMLLLFVQNENRKIRADYLYRKIWGQQMGNDNNTLKVTVSKLRSKLRNSGYSITGKRREGYCFEIAESHFDEQEVNITKL